MKTELINFSKRKISSLQERTAAQLRCSKHYRNWKGKNYFLQSILIEELWIPVSDTFIYIAGLSFSELVSKVGVVSASLGAQGKRNKSLRVALFVRTVQLEEEELFRSCSVVPL